MNSWSVLYKRHGLWDNGVGCGKALTLGESRLVPDGRNQLCLKGTHCPGSRLFGSHHVMCLPPSSFKNPYNASTEYLLSFCLLPGAAATPCSVVRRVSVKFVSCNITVPHLSSRAETQRLSCVLPEGSKFCSKAPQILLTLVGAHAPQKSSETGRPHQAVTCSALAKEGEQPVANNGVEGANTEAAEFMHFLHCFGWVFLEDSGIQCLQWARHL